MEAWHNVFNTKFRSPHPTVAKYVRVMKDEDDHWGLCMQDFENSPHDGLRGRGMDRRADYVIHDENLRRVFLDRNNRDPYHYLRSISHRMVNPLNLAESDDDNNNEDDEEDTAYEDEEEQEQHD